MFFPRSVGCFSRHRFLLRLAFAILALILFSTGLAFSSNAPASQSPDSAKIVAIDTFEVTEPKFLIIYPKGGVLSTQPYRSPESRKGVFAPIQFFIQYGNVTLMAVSFHSLKSCSAIVASLKNSPTGPGAGCDDVPRSAYSPEEFKKQRLVFQNKDSLAGYNFVSAGGRVYFYSCGFFEPGGVYSTQFLTFLDSIRVTLHMTSNHPYKCDKIYEECKNLLSKIEFIPYQKKKK